MNPIYFLIAAMVLGLTQVWTKPNFSAMTTGYGRAKWRWNWTFCILWAALAVLVALNVYPLVSPLL